MSAKQLKAFSVGISHNPETSPIGGFDNHVHAVGIRSVIAEVHNHFTTHWIALQAEKLAMTSGGFCFLFDPRKFIIQSVDKVVRTGNIVKKENRGDTIFILIHAGRYAPGPGQGYHPSFIRTKECSLR